MIKSGSVKVIDRGDHALQFAERMSEVIVDARQSGGDCRRDLCCPFGRCAMGWLDFGCLCFLSQIRDHPARMLERDVNRCKLTAMSDQFIVKLIELRG